MYSAIIALGVVGILGVSLYLSLFAAPKIKKTYIKPTTEVGSEEVHKYVLTNEFGDKEYLYSSSSLSELLETLKKLNKK